MRKQCCSGSDSCVEDKGFMTLFSMYVAEGVGYISHVILIFALWNIEKVYPHGSVNVLKIVMAICIKDC